MAADRRISEHGVAVPVARTESGLLVRPDDAASGQRYRCPGCGADVVLRSGKLRRPHFAHRRGEGCSTESTLHRAAKQLVVQVIAEWKARQGPRPCVSRPCPVFSCDGGIVQDIPEDVTHAVAEVRLDRGPVADVVLYRGDIPSAAIEILVTHAVDPVKAERIAIPWVELRAVELLERPYWWVAAQDGLEPFVCPSCSARRADASRRLHEIQGRAKRVARRIGARLPPSPPYHYAPHACWRCASEMVVYLWPGGGDHGQRRPPAPIPVTVQHRVTEGAGNYWANCCPRCSAVQGDYHLARDNEPYALVRELSRDVDP